MNLPSEDFAENRDDRCVHQEPQPSQIPEAVTPERVRALRAEAAALPTPGATPGGTEPLAAFYNRIADGLPEAVRHNPPHTS